MANWFRGLFKSEKRSASVGTETYSPALERYFGISATGTNVNETTAMRISVVYGCVRVLSESIAKLPFQVFEQTDNSKKLATGHPVYRLIRSEPNEDMTAFAFWQAIITITLLWGNGYARINRGAGGRPISFTLFEAGTVYLIKSQGLLFAQVEGELIPYYDILHIRGLGTGLVGKSPIRQSAENLGISLNAQTYANNFFINGANVGGAIKHPGKLGDTAFKHLRDSFTKQHGGVDNAHKPAILEEGMDYVKIGIPPNEAQMLETRLFGVAEICRIYGVPPHKVAELSKATFSNIEQQNIEYTTDSLLPWFARIEQEVNKKCFRENEKGRFYTKFNQNALMRGDQAARATFYDSGIKNGWLCANEIRELEDRNPIEGGDRYYVQANNMVPVDMIDQFILGKTGQNTPKTQENEQE